ncbi:putative ribonuclease H-like domain-containing protein, partial [Tanacetum coccineum]
IDYDEVFAPVARLEAIRIFLAFASYIGFIVYQMDVKSAFLYGKIDEEVYVSQPPGFQDPKYPEKVYKVVKALYGLHQAPRAWISMLLPDGTLDHFPVNSLTSKVFSFMIKKGKRFSGKVTPLFDTMLVQPTQDKGASLDRLSVEQPSPSPSPTGENQNESLPDSSSAQPRHVDDLTLQMSMILSLFTVKLVLASAKCKEIVCLNVMPEDNIDHMEADNAQSEGRTKELVDEDKELDEDRLSTEDEVSTDLEKVSTDFEKVSTDKPLVSTDGSKKIESTEEQRVGTEDQTKEEIDTQASQTSTLTPTSVIFGDDETIATLLINMSKAKATSKEKEKGVELKDVEEIERPRPTSTRSLLTLKPLPKIDPKDKGKKKIEEDDESESEDDDIPQAVKKFKQLESDEARIEADRILAEKLQEQEREQFTIEERAKFLHDTIAAQRKFLAQQRSEAIRNRPPTKNQLRNQMMTFLKHVGNFKHSELKSKKFEDIQAMYEKIKRSDEDFIAIGSVADEKLIKRMNKKDSSKGEEIKQESKEEVKKEKDEEGTRKRKLGTRKKMKSRKRRYIQNTSEDDSDKENDELRLYLTIAQDEEKEVDYEILDRKFPIKEWKTECLGIIPQT